MPKKSKPPLTKPQLKEAAMAYLLRNPPLPALTELELLPVSDEDKTDIVHKLMNAMTDTVVHAWTAGYKTGTRR
jgi:hypothetical protein